MKGFFLTMSFLTLAGCAASPTSTVPPEDKGLSRTSHLARAAFEAGATAQAIDLYSKALNRANAMDDATEIGNAAYNLAICLVVLGQLDRANASLVEAKTAFARSGSPPADVLLLEATIAQRRDKPEQALSLADQVLSVRPDERHRFQIVLLKGTIACQQDDPVAARTALIDAEQYHVTNVPLRAARERLAGSLFLLEGNPAAAAAAFDRAAALFQASKHYRDMALTLQRAGQAYREAGEPQQANDRLRRAKRSLAAQGENVE